MSPLETIEHEGKTLARQGGRRVRMEPVPGAAEALLQYVAGEIGFTLPIEREMTSLVSSPHFWEREILPPDAPWKEIPA